MPKVLIADDMKVISEMLSCILQKNGFEVVSQTHCCSTVIEKYKQLNPDLVVLDLFGMNCYSEKHKKEINSFDVIKELTQKHNAKILVITGTPKDDYINKALNNGAKDFFIKSQPIDIFIKKVNDIINYE